MSKQVEVKLDFINKKGELKHVKFWMDKQTYEMLFDESINEEIRHQYLVDEYHEYERERYYNRKFVSFDSEMAEALDLIEDSTSISSEDRYEMELNNKLIQDALKKLTPRQQEMVRLLYWEGKSQKDLCEIYGVSKQAISNALDRIHNTLKKFLKKN
ncbi:MAG: sigma-70 family RNA polymerase sigma factor [Bacilli bacterium]|nr:sigma-70 family RNA polymerase sigma factor [Bacilli bacterium]MBR2892205.1 sigma-70 family RNA polymerase sigma factor [Bacilli bacterium]